MLSGRLLDHLGTADRQFSRALLAGDPRATHQLGRWLPAAGGLALFGSLFVRWYSLRIAGTRGVIPVDLAANAPEWMPGVTWIVASTALIVAVLSAWQAWMGSFRGIPDRFVNRFEMLLCLLALVLVIWRIVVPPSLPGSAPRYHLVGLVALGPYLAAICVLVMFVGLWIRRAELTVGPVE